MKIVFQHSGILPVQKYGGTERIIFWLMKKLSEFGHEVVLIGNPKSEVGEIGVELIAMEEGKDWRQKIPTDTDVIHLFYNVEENYLDYPVIVTIEGNGQPGETFHKNTVFVSRKHAENHGGKYFVYNGLDLDEYPFERTARKSFDSFLFLGNARWKVKNLKDCIKATKKNKKSLHIAGGRKFSLSPKIKSYGMVGQEKKHELFKVTDAILWPVRWHEPFGIGIIEAFSQGLPCIGTPYGSLSELIKPVSGKICHNFDEFVEALSPKETPYNAEEIRTYLEENYTSEIMAKSYVELYEKITANNLLNDIVPMTVSLDHPETLLSF